jgi:hypothetical protein
MISERTRDRPVALGGYAQNQPVSSITPRSEAISVPYSVLSGAKVTRLNPFTRMPAECLKNTPPLPAHFPVNHPNAAVNRSQALALNLSAVGQKLSSITQKYSAINLNYRKTGVTGVPQTQKTSKRFRTRALDTLLGRMSTLLRRGNGLPRFLSLGAISHRHPGNPYPSCQASRRFFHTSHCQNDPDPRSPCSCVLSKGRSQGRSR